MQRQFLTTQLEYTDYSSYRNYARRQLYHQPATADEQKLQCDHSHNDLWGQRVRTYSIVYSTRDGSPVLSPAVLQRILLLEQNIRRWISEAEFCRRHRRAVRVGSRTVAGFCEPLDTALNYFFPSVVRPGTVVGVSGSSSNCTGINGSGCLRFDGDGFGRDAMATRAGTQCEPALSQREVDDVFGWMLKEGLMGFFSQGANGTPNGTLLGAANRSQSRRVRYLRTRFSVPLASNAGVFSPKQGL